MDKDLFLKLNIKIIDKQIDCWLSDNIGGSGISIKKENKKEFIETLSYYIYSYLEKE